MIHEINIKSGPAKLISEMGKQLVMHPSKTDDECIAAFEMMLFTDYAKKHGIDIPKEHTFPSGVGLS